MTQLPFYQDGPWFFDEMTDQPLAHYPEMVRGDHDTGGAQAARARFLQEHREYTERQNVDLAGY